MLNKCSHKAMLNKCPHKAYLIFLENNTDRITGKRNWWRGWGWGWYDGDNDDSSHCGYDEDDIWCHCDNACYCFKNKTQLVRHSNYTSTHWPKPSQVIATSLPVTTPPRNEALEVLVFNRPGQRFHVVEVWSWQNRAWYRRLGIWDSHRIPPRSAGGLVSRAGAWAAARGPWGGCGWDPDEGPRSSLTGGLPQALDSAVRAALGENESKVTIGLASFCLSFFKFF